MHDFELPTSWSMKKLGEICTKPQYGYTTKASSVGNIKFIRTTDITSGKLNWTTVPYCKENPNDIEKYQVQKNDILISRAGSIGYSFLVESTPEPAVFASYLIRFKPNDMIYPRYLKHYLNSPFYWLDLADKSAGNALQNVNAKKLSEVNIIIAPYEEQKQITTKLDQLLAQVDNIKTHLDVIPNFIEKFKKSVLQYAVTGQLTEDWRLLHKDTIKNARVLLSKIESKRESILEAEIQSGNSESKRLKKKLQKHKFDIPTEEIPSTWVWTSFTQSLLKVVDCHNKTAPYSGSGIYLIRTSDIKNGKIHLSDTKFINRETYDFWSKRCPPMQGDIIFTREAPMGEAGIVPDNTILCMGQRMMLLRCIPELMEPKYLLYNILSQSFQVRMQKNAIGTGVKHLRVGDVESLVYPLAPLEEQKEIIKRVEYYFQFADKIELQLKSTREKMDLLKQSIFNSAFQGNLTKNWREMNTSLSQAL
ncbi:restriction endonuclease subunit S [Legionella bozemanae]|uniref:restriction endonuclease subunit S n=1 Tax=Legionella bozemanae TaxID=447 RepID=UPI0013EF9BD9|nr:restriction endonuclease subunit S [Legionella bozemanae]